MRRFLLVSALCLFSGPALAAWQFESINDEQGVAFRGFVAGADDGTELEFYCDDWLPGMIDLVIYTGEVTGPVDEEAEGDAMSVIADRTNLIEVTAFIDEMDGELVVYTSNFDVDNIIDMMLLMANAQQTIDIAYQDHRFQFPAEGARSVISQMADSCPQE